MPNRSLSSTLRYSLYYSLIFGLTAIAGRYDAWLHLPPASVHQWRQADGAAIARQYARHPDFWEPAICNLFYTNDAHTVGELPVLYWISGLLMRLGCTLSIQRWLGLLVLFTGGWSFGWILLRLGRYPSVAAFVSGLLLSAPILVYYGPNYLPDAPAFCFLLVMGACLVRADQKSSLYWLAAATLSAILAILLKLSTAIVPIALTIALFKGRRQRQWPEASFWAGAAPLAAIFTAAITIFIFRGWISVYNDRHQAIYFLASTRPIWQYDLPFIRDTLVLAGHWALKSYASAGLLIATAAALLFCRRHWFDTPFIIRSTLIWTAVGSLVYFLLWFRMFREHDYYAICLLTIPALLLLSGIEPALRHFPIQRLNRILFVCLLLGLWQDHYVLSRRLQEASAPGNSATLAPDAFLGDNVLTEMGVPAEARVLCPEDPSPNTALLALGRKGWSAYNFADRVNADTLNKYQSRFGLTHLALRDSALYDSLYSRFFPVWVSKRNGWYIFRKNQELR